MFNNRSLNIGHERIKKWYQEGLKERSIVSARVVELSLPKKEDKRLVHYLKIS